MHPVTIESQQMILSAFRPSRYRSMAEFAENEIIVPSGQFEGRRYRLSRQPYARHWFNAVDSGKYSEFVITGPSQSGKSLNGFVIPLCYTLFELAETCIAAVPDDDMVREKWERDILPVIERTRYRDLLPSKGPGSRGGRVGTTQFGNGARLIWMTAGGSDKSRASVTARVVCMTETDGFDTRTSTSDEADKIKQIEARMRSYPIELQRIYKECTVSTEYGHTWSRYQQGTASRIVLRCPHCSEWVSLEREDFRGWQNAPTETSALDESAFFCGKCGEMWTESERISANSDSKLIHKGQEISKKGVILGDDPATRCFGFRWSAVNNCLIPASNVGLDEWNAQRAEDEDNAEREMCQFVWAQPYQADLHGGVRLNADQVSRKQTSTGRGQLPEGTKFISIGIDVNRPVLHWTAIAWTETEGVIFDYDTTGVDVSKPTLEGLMVSFNKLAESFGAGWVGEEWTENRSAKKPPWYDAVTVDCRWETDAVIEAIKRLELHKQGWVPFQGYGLGQFSQHRYSEPKRVGQNRVLWIGEKCHVIWSSKFRSRILHADSNHWKTWLHRRIELSDQSDKPGQLRLYATPSEKTHHNFGRHLTAEVEEIKFEPGKGETRVWNAIRSANHFGDSTYMACVAGHYSGFGKTRKPAAPPSLSYNRATNRRFNTSHFRVARR